MRVSSKSNVGLLCRSVTLPLHLSVLEAGLSALCVRLGQTCTSNCILLKQPALTCMTNDGDCGSINQTSGESYLGLCLIKETNDSISRGRLICCDSYETCYSRSPTTTTLLQPFNGHHMTRRIPLMTVCRCCLT